MIFCCNYIFVLLCFFLDDSVYFDPTNLLLPSSTEGIIDIVTSAYHDHRKVKVVGAGHSRSAIAHSSDIYISLYNYTGGCVCVCVSVCVCVCVCV